MRGFCRDPLKENISDVPTTTEEALAEEYAGDESCPAEWWEPVTIRSDLPIGQILKMPAGDCVNIFGGGVMIAMGFT
jgi:hypothetical protein